MTDYPQWPFGVSQIDRSDRALRELFGAAYFPMPVNEGEPATADRQAFVSSAFGDIFDVLVASDTHPDAINSYRALIVGGRIELSPAWINRLTNYVRGGGVVLMNAAQARGLPVEFTGVRFLNGTAEADDARSTAPGEGGVNLRGQVFRYEKLSPQGGAKLYIQTVSGDPLVTINPIGKGKVIVDAVPDMLGIDERMTPYSAHVLSHLFANATPVEVRGDVEYLVNRTARGWVVTLFNNRGVYKPQQGMAQENRTETADVSIALDGTEILAASEWIGDKRLNVTLENGRPLIKTTIAAGGVSIIELVEK
jgi:hypothetical protein